MEKNIVVIKGNIKVCGDPTCDAIWHNIPKTYTRCKNCNGYLILINQKTFFNKFSNNYFQYDFVTEEYYRPQKPIYQLYLDL